MANRPPPRQMVARARELAGRGVYQERIREILARDYKHVPAAVRAQVAKEAARAQDALAVLRGLNRGRYYNPGKALGCEDDRARVRLQVRVRGRDAANGARRSAVVWVEVGQAGRWGDLLREAQVVAWEAAQEPGQGSPIVADPLSSPGTVSVIGAECPE